MKKQQEKVRKTSAKTIVMKTNQDGRIWAELKFDEKDGSTIICLENDCLRVLSLQSEVDIPLDLIEQAIELMRKKEKECKTAVEENQVPGYEIFSTTVIA